MTAIRSLSARDTGSVMERVPQEEPLFPPAHGQSQRWLQATGIRRYTLTPTLPASGRGSALAPFLLAPTRQRRSAISALMILDPASLQLALIFGTTLVASLVLAGLVRLWLLRRQILDRPNERSAHTI